MNRLIAQAKRVAFQGELGAFGNQAAREALPHCEASPKPSFEDAVDAVRSGETELCIIPIENSIHGRIADIHHLLPDAGLYIVGEHFLTIHLQLLGLKGSKLADVKTAISQAPALGHSSLFRALPRSAPGPRRDALRWLFAAGRCTDNTSPFY